jgi:signal peptidase
MWPASLGGIFGLTVIAGKSMEPTYVLGQMVITMRAPSYGVGDVVVYKPTDFNTMVVHRLISQNPDGTFVSQGDNNAQIDPWSVSKDQPVGKVVVGLPTCDSRFCQPAFLMRLLPALTLSAGAMAVTWGMLSKHAQQSQAARHSGAAQGNQVPAPGMPGFDPPRAHQRRGPGRGASARPGN